MAEGTPVCPYCGVALLALSCPACGRTFTEDGLKLAAQWQAYSSTMTERARRLAQASEAARIEAEDAAAEAKSAVANFAAARSAAMQVLAAPPSPKQRTRVPMSVLLQGTGAVLLLAALVVGSAVLWDVLTPVIQVALLSAVVAAVGFLAVATRRAIPTSSIILAGLTVAGGLVVGLTVPYLVTALDTDLYPLVASAIGTSLLVVTGRTFGVGFWWHAGLTGIAWTGLVAVTLVIDTVDVAWSQPALFALLATPIAAGFLLATNGRDAETSRTATWLTVFVSLLVAGAAALGQGIFLADFTGRFLVLAAVLVASGSWVAIAWRWGRQSAAVLAAALLGPLPFVTFMPPADAGLLALVLSGLAVPAVAGVVAYSWVRSGSGSWSASLAAAFLVPFALLVLSSPHPQLDSGWLLTLLWGLGFGAVLWVSGLVRSLPLAGLGYLFLVGYWTTAWADGRLPAAVEVPALFAGLVALVSWWALRGRLPVWVAQVILAVTLAPTVVQSWSDQDLGEVAWWRIVWLVAGILVIGAITVVARNGWTIPVAVLAVAATGHALFALPGNSPVDPKALIIAAGVAATLGAGTVDGWISGRLAAYLSLAVAAVPSALLLVFDPAWDGQVAYRLALVSAAALAATVVVWRQPLLAWVSASLGLAIALVVWLDAVSAWEWSELELVSVPSALMVAVSWALLGRATQLPFAPWQVGVAVALIPSTVLAVADPVSGVRFAVVVLAWIMLAWWRWSRPAQAAVFGGIAVLVGLVSGLSQVLGEGREPPVELVTLPMAVAAALLAFLIHRAIPQVRSSLWWWGPVLALALWPTALVAWQDGTLNWRVWLSLALGAVVLALGVRLELAGLVVPALGGLLFVVVPVLFQWAVDLPAWIPLTIFGVALFAVGARLEATRRRGEQVLQWAVHLH